MISNWNTPLPNSWSKMHIGCHNNSNPTTSTYNDSDSQLSTGFIDPTIGGGEGGTPAIDSEIQVRYLLQQLLDNKLNLDAFLNELEKLGVENLKYTRANAVDRSISFTYNNKNYEITHRECYGDEIKDIQLFTLNTIKSYGFDDDIIEKYFTTVGTIDGKSNYFIFNETAKNENITSLNDLRDHLYGKMMDELILYNYLNGNDKGLTNFGDFKVTSNNWTRYDQDIDELIADKDYKEEQEKALNKFLEEFLAGKLDKDTAMEILSAIIGSEPTIKAKAGRPGVHEGWHVTFNFNGTDYDLYLLEDFAKNEDKNSNKLFDAIELAKLSAKYSNMNILQYFEVVAQSTTQSGAKSPIAYRLKPGMEEDFYDMLAKLDENIDSLIFDPYKENNTTGETEGNDKTDGQKREPFTKQTLQLANGETYTFTERYADFEKPDIKVVPTDPEGTGTETGTDDENPKTDNTGKRPPVSNQTLQLADGGKYTFTDRYADFEKPNVKVVLGETGETEEATDPAEPPIGVTISKEEMYSAVEDFYYNAVKNDFKEALGDCEKAIVIKDHNDNLGLTNLDGEDLDEAFFEYFYSVINSNGTISREDAKQIFDKALNEILKDFKLGDQPTLGEIYDLFCEYLNKEFKIVPATDEELGAEFCNNANFEDFQNGFSKKVQNYPLIISKNNDGTSIKSTNGETEITKDVYDYFKRLLEDLPHAEDNIERLFKIIMGAIPEGVYSLEDLFNYILEAVRTEILGEDSKETENKDNNQDNTTGGQTGNTTGNGSTNDNTVNPPVDNDTTGDQGGGTTGSGSTTTQTEPETPSTSEDNKYSELYSYYLGAYENNEATFEEEFKKAVEKAGLKYKAEIVLKITSGGYAKLENGSVDIDDIFEQIFIEKCCSDANLTDAKRKEIEKKVNEILVDIIDDLGVGTTCSIETLFEKFIEKLKGLI